MKENDRLHKRRVPHGITRVATEAQEQENLLKRDFGAQRSLKKFLTDITEVQCADGKLLVQSLSGVGRCFDNARMESFFATLKKEKIYRIAAYKLPRERVRTIFSAMLSPTTIASGSICATRLACRRRATGSGCRLTGQTPLSRHTPSAFQILGVPRLHIS